MACIEELKVGLKYTTKEELVEAFEETPICEYHFPYIIKAYNDYEFDFLDNIFFFLDDIEETTKRDFAIRMLEQAPSMLSHLIDVAIEERMLHDEISKVETHNLDELKRIIIEDGV